MSYFDDNEDRIIYGGSSRYNSADKWAAVCKRCGMGGLKWRLDNGWRLFENARVEHNRLKEHQCGGDVFDDFEDIA